MIKDMFGNARYKVALHMHTTLSDGALSPEDAAKRYKEAGFDVIAITDHWKYGEGGELAGLKVLSGCEYNLGRADTSVDVMHIVGAGMTRDPLLKKDSCTRQEVIDAIKECGGIAILAHPAWSLNTPAHALELNGFDATEIYNTVSDVGQSERPYSGYFVDLLANEGVAYPLIATDDVHYYNGEDDCVSYIMVSSASDSREDILDAIRRGDFYATQGPELHVRRDGDMLIADCSECVKIDFFSNSAWCPDKIIRGEALTHAEYKIKDFEKWVRVEVKNKDGKFAWSNIFWVK